MSSDTTRRERLILQLADHILETGLGAASLRPLAAAVGTSDRMLLYYFPDKAALLTAVLESLAARMIAMLEAHRVADPVAPDELERRLLPFVLDDALWSFMQLWLEIASLSARGDLACRHVGEVIARGFLTWVAEQVQAPSEAERHHEATRVLMRLEGAVVLKSLGLGDAVEASGRAAQGTAP